MTSSSQTEVRSAHTARLTAFGLLLVLLATALLGGCIADSAEDSDLPWATNKGWEGIAPIAPTMMDRYE